MGVGGYASAPILFVAALMNFRTVIWEPNAYPGLANRWLASWVDLALVVFDEAKLHLSNKVKRIQKVGLPVRQEVEDLARSSLLQKTQNFESSSRPFRVLVFGGSQGARGLNEIVCQAVTSAPDWLKGFELIHQTGALDFPSIRQRYMDSSLGEMGQQPDASLSASPIQVREYLPRIFEQYQWADLVLCRAGVSTISELAAAGKVAVLVPFPFASDNHQQKNAEAVVKHQAAIMILQKDFTVERFRATLSELREDPVQRQRLAQNIRRFHRPQAADETARILLKEISGSDTNNG